MIIRSHIFTQEQSLHDFKDFGLVLFTQFRTAILIWQNLGAPDNILHHSNSDLRAELTSITQNSQNAIYDTCLGNDLLSEGLRLSSRVRAYPDYLINHLDVVSMQNQIDVFDDLVLGIEYFWVTVLAIRKMD